ncbi:MAG: signal recognition particle-docking protein FtsY [Aestuariivirga sp.]|nr:signal recognition particle-docking protein FtsY [Aestuariivirga sp.]
MSGFFKKLFNRIVGKTEEAPPPPPVVEQLEAPAPVIVKAIPEPVEPEPRAEVKPEPKAKAAPEPKKAEPKPKAKLEPKKAEAVKPEPKKAEPKKVEVKKVEAVKPEPKKAEVKKPEPKKPESKKVEPKKVEVKKVEPVKPEPKKVEANKPEPIRPEPKKIVPPPKPAPQEKIEVEVPVPKIEVAAPPPVVEEAPAPFPVIVPVAPEPEPVQAKGWLSRLTQGLSKSSKSITTSITSIFTKRKLDATTLEELEDVLIQADLGIAVSERIIKAVSAGRYDKEIEPEEVKRILAEEVAKVLKPVEVPFNFGSEKPFVILVVGVNGAGKTTTIGKLGAIATGEGFKVMFVACDTFRAAAIEQLTIWGERIGAKTLSRPTGSDSSGLAYDAMQTAKEDGTDILFIDTAGRLQNKAYLMDELDKIVRVVKKQDETAPHAVLLILDATTGQNAISQAEIFTKVAGVTGLIMTKLDGTARGGILVAIAEKFALPIHAIGVGETIDDLQPFDADAFARAISGIAEP